jgi:drug/metabolite transporter (DMT)-like permease
MLISQTALAAPGAVSGIALPFGVCASVAILAFQAGIRHGDIATSWLAINLSSGVPTVASILIYHEALDWKRVTALCLIPVSMALLWKDKREADNARG